MCNSVTVINDLGNNYYYSYLDSLVPMRATLMSNAQRQFSTTLEAIINSVSSPLFTIPIHPWIWALRLGSRMTLVTGVIDGRCEDRIFPS